MAISEDRLITWSLPLSETGETKCENALNQISAVLRKKFGNSITIERQGSYRNRTNVRVDSDVDILVIHDDYHFSDTTALPENEKKIYEANRVTADYTFQQFRSDIQALLQAEFGLLNVESKNKCIRVKGNTYRINADVVPAYRHKRYSRLNVVEAEGVAFLKDFGSGDRVVSFPQHHYDNGVAKNTRTSRSFKSMVRILKNARNEMIDQGKFPKDIMSSFFLECLVWNVPDHHFSHSTYKEMARAVTLHVWGEMKEIAKAHNYAEVSDLMWLFKGNTKRTPQQAEDFMLRAWSHITQ